MRKILVRIVECSNDGYWYKDKIGQVFRVHPINDGYYELFDVDMMYIWGEDAVEIEVISASTESASPGGDPAYLQLLEDMKQLHIKKNAGYSGDSSDRWANFRLSEELGVSSFLGVMVRMSDKWIRITNLIKNPKFDQVGESIDDTLMDLASYALIAICIRREKKEKQ